jgi:CheY-like chemotaxis protein
MDATAGREARGEVSWLVLDVHLDGMSGVELAEHIAARGWRLPFVVLTACHDEELERRDRRAGARAIFQAVCAPRPSARCAVDALGRAVVYASRGLAAIVVQHSAETRPACDRIKHGVVVAGGWLRGR